MHIASPIICYKNHFRVEDTHVNFKEKVMLCYLLFAQCCSEHFVYFNSCHPYNISTTPLYKCRNREVMKLARVMSSEWWVWDLNLGLCGVDAFHHPIVLPFFEVFHL